MTLEFSAAIFGAEKEFELSHLEVCEVCTGTGAKIGSKTRICSTCGGRGQVMRTEQTPFGMFSQVISAFDSSREIDVEDYLFLVLKYMVFYDMSMVMNVLIPFCCFISSIGPVCYVSIFFC